MSVTQTFRGKVDVVNSGVALDQKYIGSTSPGSLIDLFSYTVPLGNKLIALQVFVTCRLECKITIKQGADQIASGRTGSGVLNFRYDFDPYREITENEVLKVECLAMSGRPTTDIEAYLQARIIPL